MKQSTLGEAKDCVCTYLSPFVLHNLEKSLSAVAMLYLPTVLVILSHLKSWIVICILPSIFILYDMARYPS